jgi:hypothetical protein
MGGVAMAITTLQKEYKRGEGATTYMTKEEVAHFPTLEKLLEETSEFDRTKCGICASVDDQGGCSIAYGFPDETKNLTLYYSVADILESVEHIFGDECPPEELIVILAGVESDQNGEQAIVFDLFELDPITGVIESEGFFREDLRV